MLKSKMMRLVLMTVGTTFALGGCASNGLLPWVVGAGLITWLGQQSG